MFKNFSKDDIHTRTALKSSLTRNLRTKAAEQFPLLTPYIDEILPKKQQVTIIKCSEKVTLYTLGPELLFFQRFDEDLIPSLRLVHKFPECFPQVKVDRGAIKFLLSGANCMAPGLTSAGAELPQENIPAGRIVAIHAQGKEHACSVGILKMSIEDIKSINKGIACSFALLIRRHWSRERSLRGRRYGRCAIGLRY